jgi:hypothetical protein
MRPRSTAPPGPGCSCDLTAAKAVCGALLGVAPDVDQPYYVGYTADGQHIGLNPGHTRPVTDIRTDLQEVKGVGDGKLIAEEGTVLVLLHLS